MSSKMLLSVSVIFVLCPSLFAREIVFPPVDAVYPYLSSLRVDGSLDDVDIVTGSQFSGLTTFAHLPYVNCFVDNDDAQKYDIAFLGAPFDTLGENTFEDWASIVDCGDAPLTFLDNTVALKQLEKAHKVISARAAATTRKSSIPRIITLGGDHTTTLAALRSTYAHWGQVSVIHFDSHIDTWDPKTIGGGISHYAGVNHGTFLHLAHEEGLIRNTSIHAGIRAPLVRPKGDLRNDIRCGFEIVRARDIDRIGISGVIEKLKSRIGDTNVYVSVDIDVLDPAFAPATGTAEVGGWTTRELLSILDGLKGIRIIGGDIVEVAPIYDSAGEITVLAAAEIAHSLMTLMVHEPVQA
ncbi:hypothetical protein MMC11_003132 [Xylographa trunciseda]|nr:hypothetical protein [Xylographa trunciseda]